MQSYAPEDLMAAVAPSACIADITIAVWLFIADITIGA